MSKIIKDSDLFIVPGEFKFDLNSYWINWIIYNFNIEAVYLFIGLLILSICTFIYLKKQFNYYFLWSLIPFTSNGYYSSSDSDSDNDSDSDYMILLQVLLDLDLILITLEVITLIILAGMKEI
jgi:hypothetical protein